MQAYGFATIRFKIVEVTYHLQSLIFKNKLKEGDFRK